MTDGEKKTSERTPVKKNVKIKILIAAIAFTLFPYLFMYWSMTDNWYIFTQKRIEMLEEIFQTDFPDNTEFKSYLRLNGMDGGADWLYISGISDPEDFCRSCVNIPIEFMADIEKAKVIEYGSYTEDAAANQIEYFTKEKIRWKNDEKRYIVFFCIFQSEGYRGTSLYFSENNNGGYDVKMEIQ